MVILIKIELFGYTSLDKQPLSVDKLKNRRKKQHFVSKTPQNGDKIVDFFAKFS